MEKSNEILESRKKKKKKKKESIREKIFKHFSNFLETARYSACLRDNTLDVGAPLHSFRRLSPTSTRDKKERQREKKGEEERKKAGADRLGVGDFFRLSRV